MNICFATSEYASPSRGGIERVTTLLKSYFEKCGHNVWAISKDLPLSEGERQTGCLTLPSEEDILHSDNINFFKNFCKIHSIDIIINQSHHAAMLQLCSYVKNEKCKIISVLHVSPRGLLDELGDRIAQIHFSQHGIINKWGALCFNSLKYPLRHYNMTRWMNKKYHAMYDKSDACVLLSESFKNDFSAIGKLNSQTRLFAIPDPCSSFIAAPAEKSREKVILFVGRLEYSAKRPDRIVKIWKEVSRHNSDWQLYILGDGAARVDLENYCKRYNLQRIKFTGNIDPSPYYQSAAILCMTSSVEGFGMVLIEALQNGIVPIAYDSYSAIHDIIADGQNGVLVRPFKLKEYCQELNNLMNKTAYREQLRQNAMLSLENFRPERVVEKWEQLFESIRVNSIDPKENL